jgi:Zn finger protein HypA/HybF involved in hydrogenase expression
MIECQECGEVYEPETDAYRCPCCGAENYPDGGGGEPDGPG